MNPVVQSAGWRARLENAIDQGVGVQSPEWITLWNLSSSWDTCAVGENSHTLNEKGYEFTNDDILFPVYGEEHYRLGKAFMYAVDHAEWQKALDILDQIENLPDLSFPNRST